MAVRNAGGYGRGGDGGVSAPGLPTVNTGGGGEQTPHDPNFGTLEQQVISGVGSVNITPTQNGTPTGPPVPVVGAPFLNDQRRSELQAALSQTFSGINGGITNGAIISSLDRLLGVDGWNSSAIAAVNSGATTTDGGHDLSFREQGGNAQPFINAWSNNILSALAGVTTGNQGGNGVPPTVPPWQPPPPVVIEPPPPIDPPFSFPPGPVGTKVDITGIVPTGPTPPSPVPINITGVVPTGPTPEKPPWVMTPPPESPLITPHDTTFISNPVGYFQLVVTQLLNGGTLISKNPDGSQTIRNAGGFVETVNPDGSQRSGAYGEDPVTAAQRVVAQAQAQVSSAASTPANPGGGNAGTAIPYSPTSADLAQQLIGQAQAIGSCSFGGVPGSGSVGGGIALPDPSAGTTGLTQNAHTSTSNGPNTGLIVVVLGIAGVVFAAWYFMRHKKSKAA